MPFLTFQDNALGVNLDVVAGAAAPAVPLLRPHEKGPDVVRLTVAGRGSLTGEG